MLITPELLLCDDLRGSLFTVGSMTVERKPALESVVSDYAGLYATTPPGVWVRPYKGRNWLTQSVPVLPFFDFLSGWRHVPDVPRFLDAHYHFVPPSPGAMAEARVNVWIGWPDGADPVTVGAVPSKDDYTALVA
ncbi:hypothetical protein LVO39_002593 [Salmonella enterica]|uniref:Uncharacterized protein n=1 Tax=Salmonella enterica subsp. enterica serovar Rough O:d:1,7 TaxID=1974323 RepID=A0A974QDG9_SALET|nr:hypothetical protein [Salmonella enterica]ECD7244677.1 hypothetical protein [Salmonella enterica subsp. enterica serovar Florida]ECF4168080.1 hypothetical protein [Salmonella enterica subsp. enterica serovar Florida]ECW2476697.1 hypothetical protein [Salmonella enterica subsp. enterica serovar Florida]EIQ6926369.1 hypothetical protein [Salmonella enterica]EJS1433673.1 hypothetical protein [Salmonella enterica]